MLADNGNIKRPAFPQKRRLILRMTGYGVWPETQNLRKAGAEWPSSPAPCEGVGRDRAVGRGFPRGCSSGPSTPRPHAGSQVRTSAAARATAIPAAQFSCRGPPAEMLRWRTSAAAQAHDTCSPLRYPCLCGRRHSVHIFWGAVRPLGIAAAATLRELVRHLGRPVRSRSAADGGV